MKDERKKRRRRRGRGRKGGGGREDLGASNVIFEFLLTILLFNYHSKAGNV